MKFWNSLLAGAVALAALLVADEAAIAGQVLCRAQGAGTGTQAGTIGGSIGGSVSSVPSKTLYTMNSDGCVAVAQQDVGYFQSQGYYPGTNLFSVSIVGLGAASTTSNSPILPAGAMITGISVQETSGNAVTGGLDIGTAASGAQVVSAFTVAASANLAIPPASILLFEFPATGTPKAQQIFFNAHTNWTDTATINATIFYSLVLPY